MSSFKAVLLLTAAASLYAGSAVAQQPPAPDTAETSDNGQGITVFEPAFFADSQPNTAFDMIARVPGFSFDEGDDVRGFGGAAGNVLIDGRRPASKSEPLADTIRRIQPGQVARIELIRGGAPGIDMQGQPVVVNIVRRTDARSQTLLAIASGLYQDGRTTPAMRFEGTRLFDGDRRLEWSGLIYNFVDDGAGEGPRTRRDGTGALIRDGYSDETGGGEGLTLSGVWQQPFGGGRLSTNARHNSEIYDWSLEDAIFTPVPGSLEVRDRNETATNEIGMNWDRPLSERTRLELVSLVRIRNSEFVSDFDDGVDTGVFTEDATSGESILRATLRQTRTPTWSVEGGGEVAYNVLDSSTGYEENGTPVVLPSADVKVEETRAEVFATSTWRPSARWAVEAGLRVEVSTISQSGDANQEETFVYPKPRVQLTWTPAEGNQFRFRVEREVGQLDFGDFVSSTAFSTGVVTAGNADLVPDQTWVFSATWERRFWDDGALVVTLQHSEITDATDRVPVVTATDIFDAPGNIGEGRSDELSVDLTLPLDRLGLTGGRLRTRVSVGDSEVTDPTTGLARPISGFEDYEGEINFTQDVPSMRLQWGANLFFEAPETYYAFDQLTTYDVEPWLNVFVDWRVRPDLALRVEVQNLTGRNFIREREVYAGPRDTSPLLFTERRDLNFDPFLYVRLRRTWG